MSHLFASPSTGFSRIFTTSVFSEKRFSTQSIDSLRLPGLTWTVIFMLLFCPFYACVDKWGCNHTHQTSENPVWEYNTPHKCMITSPERDISRNIHGEIDEECSIDTLRDDIWEVGREPERFSLKSITESAEDDDIEDIRDGKSRDTGKREAKSLAKNGVKCGLFIDKYHTWGERSAYPRKKGETNDGEERYSIDTSCCFITPYLGNHIVDAVDKRYEKYSHWDLKLGNIYRSKMERNISDRWCLDSERLSHEYTEDVERCECDELCLRRRCFVWFFEEEEHSVIV